jgi:GNAT superfamily N-acetyltransferase
MPYQVYTLEQRPDVRPRLDHLINPAWPRFMMQAPVAVEHAGSLYTLFAPFQFVLCDEHDALIAFGNSIPVVWDGTIDGLPAGWDAVMEQAVRDHQSGRVPNTLSALSITVDLQQRGRGISSLMVQAMRSIAATHGFKHLIAPVRPSFKSRYPLTPIQRYVEWRLPDGAPFDPWLRVHWRLGARILKSAPRSMVIPGTVVQWEEWTQMRFPESGAYVVPGALELVEINREEDQGVYVEPNVWMCHSIDTSSANLPLHD